MKEKFHINFKLVLYQGSFYVEKNNVLKEILEILL